MRLFRFRRLFGPDSVNYGIFCFIELAVIDGHDTVVKGPVDIDYCSPDDPDNFSLCIHEL